MSNMPTDSRVLRVRQLTIWLHWVFVRAHGPAGERDIRYAIETGRDLMLTEEEMAPLRHYMARTQL